MNPAETANPAPRAISTITSLDQMVEELTEMVGCFESDFDRVTRAVAIVDRTIQGAEHLDFSRFVPGERSYSRHLIHRDPDNRFAVLCLVWKPGQGTPIHDHPSWGVVGVLKNRMRFVNYVLQDSQPRLTVAEQTIGAEGTVTTVFPPHADIHRMECPREDGAVSMTIHCYGREITEFNIYSPETAEKRPGAVSYDSLP